MKFRSEGLFSNVISFPYMNQDEGRDECWKEDFHIKIVSQTFIISINPDCQSTWMNAGVLFFCHSSLSRLTWKREKEAQVCSATIF